MIQAQIEGVVRAAVARAGYSSDLVPELLNLVCFHIIMGNENATPDRIGLLIGALMPGLAEAMAQETRAAGLELTISRTTH